MKRGMKSVKSQVTIFIIIAIVLLGTVAISFFAFKKTSSFDSQFSSDIEVQSKFVNIRTSIQDCMKFASQDALDIIGYQGGYFKKPAQYYDLSWVFVPYYYKQGKIFMPSNLEVQKQLGAYVDDTLKICIDSIDFEDFNISYSNAKTTAKINSEEVIFSIDSALTLTRGDKTARFELRDEPIAVSSKLKDMLEVAKFITENHGADETVCISCINQMAIEKNLFVNMLDWPESSTLFVISTNNTELYPPDFEFLNKYSPVKNIDDITI